MRILKPESAGTETSGQGSGTLCACLQTAHAGPFSRDGACNVRRTFGLVKGSRDSKMLVLESDDMGSHPGSPTRKLGHLERVT